MEKTQKVNELIAYFEKIILSQIHFRVEKYPINDPMLETEVIPSISKIYGVREPSDGDLSSDVSEEKLAANVLKGETKDELQEELKPVEHKVQADGATGAATTTNIESSGSEEANDSQSPDESFFAVITKFKELEERASKCPQIKSPARTRYMKIRGKDATVHVDDDIRHKLEEILKKHLNSKSVPNADLNEGTMVHDLECLECENQLNEA